MYPAWVILIYITSFVVTVLVTPQAPLTEIDFGPYLLAMEKSSSETNTVVLSDVIGSSHSANAFSGFTRSFASVTRILEDENSNITVLAPTNRAIMTLPQRPWENPSEYSTLGEEAYEGKKGEERALNNLRKFVETHLISVSPWKEGEKAESLTGREYCWHMKEGVRTIQPGNIVVIEVLNSVRNGELWVIDRPMN